MRIKIKGTVLLFLLLESIAVSLTILADNNKRIFMFNVLAKEVGKAYSFSFAVSNYFYLVTENQLLNSENKRLLEKGFNCAQDNNNKVFSLIAADLVKNSIDRTNNLLVVSAGKKQGVRNESGVISISGNIVGTVISISDNYSAVLSVLNRITSVSILHKKTNTLGTLKWDGRSPRFMIVEDIPTYIPVHKGDTLITSGYSQIFPKGVIVGTVYSVRKNIHKNTYELSVLLAEDMRKLRRVYIVTNRDKAQIDSLLLNAYQLIH